jgi:hypothetical protein
MFTELSKKDKRIAREIIAKGLDEDFKRGMLEFETILQKWRSESGDNREYYSQLYGSVAWQLRDKLIDTSELDALNTEVKDYLLHLVSRE